MSRRSRRTPRNWSFIEMIVFLFFLGLILEILVLFVLKSAGFGWLWILPGIATLVGLMWLVAREPANL